MSTTTRIGSFRDVIEGADCAPSFRDLAMTVPDDTGTVTDEQRRDVAAAYSAAVDAVLASHGITRWGDDLIGDAGRDYADALEAAANDISESVDFFAIAESAVEGYDRGSYGA